MKSIQRYTHAGVGMSNRELSFLCSEYGIDPAVVVPRGPRWTWDPSEKEAFDGLEIRLRETFGAEVGRDVLSRISELLSVIRNYRKDTREFRDRLNTSIKERANYLKNAASQRINKVYSMFSTRRIQVDANVCWPSSLAPWQSFGVTDITREHDRVIKSKVDVTISVMQAMRISEHNIALIFRSKPFFTVRQELIESDYLAENNLIGYRLRGVSAVDEGSLKRLIKDAKAEAEYWAESGDEGSAADSRALVKNYELAQYNGSTVEFTLYVVRSKYARHTATDLPISGEGFTLAEALSLFQRRVKQETYKAL